MPDVEGRNLDVRVREVLSVRSLALTTADLVSLPDSVTAQLADPQVSGVVITHGTDTLEETAILLQHADPARFEPW